MLVKLEEAKKQYTEAKKAYYEGNPIMSDAQFDFLEEWLKDTMGEDHPFFTVGSEGDYEIEHDRPMLSLRKVKEDEVDQLFDWMGDKPVLITLKMDGTAGSLIYEGGKLSLAKTRGDGKKGKNITRFMKFIDSVPDQIHLDGKVEVRGEFVVSKDDFAKLQARYIELGLDPPSSIRNCVAGILNPNRKENHDLAQFLTFVAYDIVQDTSYYFDEGFKLDALGRAGFALALMKDQEIKVTDSHQDILDVIQWYKDNRDKLNFATDGIVFAYLRVQDQIDAGMHKLYPKGKIAFKIISETAVTTIMNIVFETTRTGKLSCVAEVEPVEISGAKISRVSLFNPGYMLDHQISCGDKIRIVRSGEIIPKYLETVEKSNSKPVFPRECPSCGEALRWSKTGTDLICDNINCESQMILHIIHWVKTLDIKGISSKTIEALWDANLIRDIPDLYGLFENEIASVDGLGRATYKTLKDGLNEKTNMPLEMFLRGLGIPNIGKTMSANLAQKFGSLNRICKISSFDELDGLPNAADKTKIGILDAISVIAHYARRLDFLNVLDYIPDEQGTLSGKSFIITGSVNHPKKRKGVEEDIKAAGGTIQSTVNDKLSYLVINEQNGSSKEQKATKLGIPMITEEELYNIIKGDATCL